LLREPMTVTTDLFSFWIHLLFPDKIESCIKMDSSSTREFQPFLKAIKVFVSFFKTPYLLLGCLSHKNPFQVTSGEKPHLDIHWPLLVILILVLSITIIRRSPPPSPVIMTLRKSAFNLLILFHIWP
jgi:hypothetical protein